MVRAGYGSAAELHDLPLADFLAYMATEHHHVAQQTKALRR